MKVLRLTVSVLGMLTGLHPASTPVSDATSTATADWRCIRWYESRGQYRNHSNEPYTGAYQIANYIWHRVLGLPGQAWQASRHTQDLAALALWHDDLRIWGDPWHAWETAPLCDL